MKSNCFLRLIIGCFMLWGISAAQAASVPVPQAKAWADEKGQMLLQAFSEQSIKAKYRKLDELFLNHVDLDYIGKFVIGKYWRQMNAAQREKYQEIFKRYAIALYKTFPLNFDADRIAYKILSAKTEKEYTTVTAMVTVPFSQVSSGSENADILLEFRLHEQGGKIMLVDLKIAESSMILSYRGRFYDMFAKDDGDVEWFLEDLELITVSAEETNRQNLEDAELN